MKTHGNLWLEKREQFFYCDENGMKNAGCKCTWAIFILSDSAFIFITAINIAKWIFQQFLKTHYVLFQWSIFCSVNMEMEWGWCMKKYCITEACLWCSGWDYQLKYSWREYPLFKYLWARHCNDLSMAAASSSSVGIHRKLPSVYALCNPSHIRLSKATAETCLVKSAT